MPLEAGLKRILSNFNYSFTYDSNGNLSDVTILNKTQNKSKSFSFIDNDKPLSAGKMKFPGTSKFEGSIDTETEEIEHLIHRSSKAIPISLSEIPKCPPSMDAEIKAKGSSGIAPLKGVH